MKLLAGEPKEEPKKRSFWRELPGLLLTALVIAVVIKTFLIQPFYIPSESMLPTIHINDRVMVNKLSARFGEPQRFDVVVFTDPAAPEREESFLPFMPGPRASISHRARSKRLRKDAWLRWPKASHSSG